MAAIYQRGHVRGQLARETFAAFEYGDVVRAGVIVAQRGLGGCRSGEQRCA
jgi:hypothetical protein